MDTMLVVQLSFYLLVFVLVFAILFAICKSLLLLVFARKPKHPPSMTLQEVPRRTAPHNPDTIKPQEKAAILSNTAPPPVFMGHLEQPPNVLCRKTGQPILYCNCTGCSRKHGKVGN